MYIPAPILSIQFEEILNSFYEIFIYKKKNVGKHGTRISLNYCYKSKGRPSHTLTRWLRMLFVKNEFLLEERNTSRKFSFQLRTTSLNCLQTSVVLPHFDTQNIIPTHVQ